MLTVKPFWKELRYFVPREFDSRDLPGSGGAFMDEAFMRRLDSARLMAEIPFKITSGYRTRSRNIAVGGAVNSGHIYGKAADIVALTPQTRFKVVAALLAAGFNRIEVSPDGHVHVDSMASPSHPANVLLIEVDGKGV
jgi:zinc D-Ala-D-Ala carboxypeptidase